MASDDLIEVDAKIVEVFPGGYFAAEYQQGGVKRVANVHLAGKLRKNKIRVVLGDDVVIGLTPYDPSKGRIVFRNK